MQCFFTSRARHFCNKLSLLITATATPTTKSPLLTNLSFQFKANFHLSKKLTMPRNVEIKANVKNLEELKKKARLLADDQGTLIQQEDTFFKVPNGRLKLRDLKGKKSVLVQYNRPDQTGPKLSDFKLIEIEDSETLKAALTEAMGVLGVVKKDRVLVMLGQTRIHLDQVAELGDFMELEVCLRDEQTLEEGQKIAEDIMANLGIEKSDLIDCAYMDMILKGK